MSASKIHKDGVAVVLHEVETEVMLEMHKRLDHPSIYIRSDLSIEERDKICELAAALAKKAAANGIGQAFQMGINKNATEAEHEAPTRKISVT